jgi:hypothetical protein
MSEERLKKWNTTDLEANRDKLQAAAEQQKAHKEGTAVEAIEALKDCYGDRYLAVGCRRQPKKMTQGDDMS